MQTWGKSLDVTQIWKYKSEQRMSSVCTGESSPQGTHSLLVRMITTSACNLCGRKYDNTTVWSPTTFSEHKASPVSKRQQHSSVSDSVQMVSPNHFGNDIAVFASATVCDLTGEALVHCRALQPYMDCKCLCTSRGFHL